MYKFSQNGYLRESRMMQQELQSTFYLHGCVELARWLSMQLILTLIKLRDERCFVHELWCFVI